MSRGNERGTIWQGKRKAPELSPEVQAENAIGKSGAIKRNRQGRGTQRNKNVFGD
jgi:hypothetical protein